MEVFVFFVGHACHAESLRLQAGDFCTLPGSRLPRRKFKFAGGGFVALFLGHACHAESSRLQAGDLCTLPGSRLPRRKFKIARRGFLHCSWITPATPKVQDCRPGIFALFLGHACHAEACRRVIVVVFLGHACHAESLRLQAGDFCTLPGSRLPRRKFKIAGGGFVALFLGHACHAESLRLHAGICVLFLGHACHAESSRLQAGDLLHFSWVTPATPKV